MHQTNAGIMIFPDGLIGATGNQTAGESETLHPSCPPTRCRSAVAVTLYNEFAFVTVWDTDTLQGQIAVLALARHRARRVPLCRTSLLPNEGGFQNIQLLGYIDLARHADTDCDLREWQQRWHARRSCPSDSSSAQMMDDPAVRQAFARDDYERWVPTQGHAVVISRWEGKATLIDLSPLFQFVRTVYFGAEEESGRSRRRRTCGRTPSRSNPEMMPLVVATVAIDQADGRASRQHVATGADPNSPRRSRRGSATSRARSTSGTSVHSAPTFVRFRPKASRWSAARRSVRTSRRSHSSAAGGFNNDAVVASRGDRSIAWVHVGEQTADVVAAPHPTLG